MVLMKLRLILKEKDLADRFHLSQSTVSSTFRTWIKVLACVLKNVIYVPDRVGFYFRRPERFNNVRDG